MTREKVLLDQRDQVLLAEMRGHQFLQVAQSLLHVGLRVIEVGNCLHLAQVIALILLVKLLCGVDAKLVLLVIGVGNLMNLYLARCPLTA